MNNATHPTPPSSTGEPVAETDSGEGAGLAPARIKFVDGIPMADVPMTGKWITNEDIIRAQTERG